MRSLDSTLKLAEIIDAVRGDIANERPIAPLHAQRLLAYIDDLHAEAVEAEQASRDTGR